MLSIKLLLVEFQENNGVMINQVYPKMLCNSMTFLKLEFNSISKLIIKVISVTLSIMKP